MVSTIRGSTDFQPVAVTLVRGEQLSGLSRHKLRKAADEGIETGDGSRVYLEMRKAGSQTLIVYESLCRLIEALPRYQPHTATPEAVEMIAARKRRAKQQLTKKTGMQAAE